MTWWTRGASRPSLTRGWWLGLVFLGLTGSWCVEAQGQTHEAVAEALFAEGKQLYLEGRYTEACEKLAQSHKADPAGGTVLLLAMCYEKEGRSASAWVKYSEALAMARRDGRADRADRAEATLAKLQESLTYLSLKLSQEISQLEGLELRLDGVVIPPLGDAAVPIDPGLHTLTVAAPGHRSYRTEFAARPPKELLTIEIPPLDPLPEEPAPEPVAAQKLAPLAPTPTPEPEPSSATRTWAYVTAGVGVAALGVGGYLGYRAFVLDDEADRLCGAGTTECTDPKGVSTSEKATERWTIGSLVAGGGVAALATATVLFVVSSHDEPSSTIAARAQARPGGMWLGVAARY